MSIDENEKLSPNEAALLVRPLVDAVLERCGGDKERAARILNEAFRRAGVDGARFWVGDADEEATS